MSINISLDPLTKGSNIILSNNNLTSQIYGSSNASLGNGSAKSNKYVISGKWYLELTINSYNSTNNIYIGIVNSTNNIIRYYFLYNGKYYDGTNEIAYGTGLVANDVLGMAIDLDNKTLKFSKNNIWYNEVSIPTIDKCYIILATGTSTTSYYTISTINFGATPFKYSAPTGFYALNKCETYIIKQGNDILSTQVSDFNKIGIGTINQQHFLDYGTEDISILNTSQSKNTSHGIDKGSLTSGKYFNIIIPTDFKSVDNIKIKE